MKSVARLLPLLALALLIAFLVRWSAPRGAAGVEVHRAAAHDVSPPLVWLRGFEAAPAELDCAKMESGCGTSPANRAERDEPDDPDRPSPQGRGAPNPPPPPPPIPPAGMAVEQRTQGTRPAAVVMASFDGMGFGFMGPQGPGRGGNPSDNSLAVGPNHIVQIVNGSGIAIFSKKGEMFDTTGKVLYGAVPSKSVFKGFGGACEAAN